MLTKDFSVGTIDPDGDFNQAVAKATRQALQDSKETRQVIEAVSEMKVEPIQDAAASGKPS